MKRIWHTIGAMDELKFFFDYAKQFCKLISEKRKKKVARCLYSESAFAQVPMGLGGRCGEPSQASYPHLHAIFMKWKGTIWLFEHINVRLLIFGIQIQSESNHLGDTRGLSGCVA